MNKLVGSAHADVPNAAVCKAFRLQSVLCPSVAVAAPTGLPCEDDSVHKCVVSLKFILLLLLESMESKMSLRELEEFFLNVVLFVDTQVVKALLVKRCGRN